MDSPVIQLRLKGRLVQTLPFEGDALRIGRLKENDIVISNASVSRFHAVLRRENGQIILEDSGSENGCYVNGTRVASRTVLEPGDEILIGKHQLVLSEATDEDASLPEVAKDGKNDAWDASKTYFVGVETQAKMLEGIGSEPGAVTDPEREADSSLEDASEAALEAIEAPTDEAVVESVEESLENAESEPIDVGAEELEARTPATDDSAREGELAAIFAPADLDADGASGGFEFGSGADPGSSEGETDQEIEAEEYDVEPVDEEPRQDAEQALEIAGLSASEANPAEEGIWHAGLIVQNRGKLDRIISWDRDQLVAGRSRDCDIYLDEAEISRRHAMFIREDGGYEVRDLDSANGLQVNGEKSRGCSLEVGDVVKIEGYEFTFLLDRHSIGSEVKTDAPPSPIAAETENSFNMTILDEELPIGPAITNPSVGGESLVRAEGEAVADAPAAGLYGIEQDEGPAEMPEVDLYGLDEAEEEEAPEEMPAVDLCGIEEDEGPAEMPAVDLCGIEEDEGPAVGIYGLDEAEEEEVPEEMPAVDLYGIEEAEEEEAPAEMPAGGLYAFDDAEEEGLIEVEEVSPPVSEVEVPGIPVVTDEVLSFELKVRLADLPEPLRAAMADLGEGELKLPVEIVLKTDE